MDIPAPAVPARTFLASARLHWLDWQVGAEEPREGAEELKVLWAVHEKRYEEAIRLVESLQVPVCRRLANIGPYDENGPSLLHLSMESSFAMPPAIGDVQLLLRTAKLRGEALSEDDFAAACATGNRQIIALLRDAGAPMCRDALHHALGGCCRPSRTGLSDATACAQLLLDARCSINGLSETGNSPLTTSILRSLTTNVPLVNWLLQQKADADGSGGSRLPLHSLFTTHFPQGSTMSMLVQHKADVNRKAPLSGSTPLHLAVHPRVNLKAALALKALGADCALRDDEGQTAAELLLAAGKPEAAAELEGREMNAEEEELSRAQRSPVARAFEQSGFRSVGWTLRSSPVEGVRMYDDEDDDHQEGEESEPGSDHDFLEQTVSSILDGHNPKTVVITLPLTRYSELNEDVEFSAPRPEGFIAREILECIYNFYQEPLSTAQLSRIEKFYDTGHLGDSFGYIKRSLPSEDCEAREHRKRRAVPRIDLRGDCIYFEGFGDCAYFEEQRKLTCKMRLGS